MRYVNILHKLRIKHEIQISHHSKVIQSSAGFMNFNFLTGVSSIWDFDFLNFFATVSTRVDSSCWNLIISSTETSISSSFTLLTLLLSSNSNSSILSNSGFMPRNERLPHFSPSHTTKLFSEMYFDLENSRWYLQSNCAWGYFVGAYYWVWWNKI